MGLDDLLVHFLLKEIFSLSGHAPRQGGQGHPAGGDAAGSAQQEQVLYGALLHGPVTGLAQPDEARLHQLRGPFRLPAPIPCATIPGRMLLDADPGDVEEVRLSRIGVAEHGAAQPVGSESLPDRGREAVEDRLAGVQPDRFFAALGLVHRQPLPRLLRIGFEGGQQGIGRAGPVRHQGEGATRVPFQAQVEERRGVLDETAHVSRQQAAVVLLLHLLVEIVQPAAHLAAVPVEGALSRRQGQDLLLGEVAFHLTGCGLAAVLTGHRLLQVVPHGQPLEETAHHVEDLVGTELLADRLELVEQRLEHPALARAGGDEVDDDHGIVLLAVAVDAAHALFQPGRVPGDVVVHHEPAELQVDPLAGSVGGYQVGGPALFGRPAEQLDLALPLRVSQAAVDQGDAAGVAEAFEAAHQETAVSRCSVKMMSFSSR